MVKYVSRKTTHQSNSSQEFSGIQELLDSEQGLAGYNLDVVRKLSNGLGVGKSEKGVPAEVIEFGAGTGALAEVWRSEYQINPVCIEIDPKLILILQSKGFDAYASIKSAPSDIPFIYTSNVLEHIEDDIQALTNIRERMKPGGRIGIYVPALPLLFSNHDRRVGHYRRYKKKELVHKVRLAGFEIEKYFYNDCVGVLAAVAVRLFGYKNKMGFGSQKSRFVYDKYLYPISKFLDGLIFKYVIGKNLFVFAVNPKK